MPVEIVLGLFMVLGDLGEEELKISKFPNTILQCKIALNVLNHYLSILKCFIKVEH